MEILKWLDASSIVGEYRIEEYKAFRSGFYLRIRVRLKNQTELFIREYSDLRERSYSYHWQDEKGGLIARWDNAPHYPEMLNAPHHKHLPDGIEPSSEVTFQEVLKVISETIHPSE